MFSKYWSARRMHSPINEITLLRLAAILHDISRLDEPDNHATVGAAIAARWLQSWIANNDRNINVERLHDLIASHSDKGIHETDFSKAVLKDADILDEIGVISLFMASNWIERQSPFFFHRLRERLKGFEIPYCERQLGRLNTIGGRVILSEKKAFIEKLITQLDDELQCASDAEQLLVELSQENDGG